MEDGEIPVKQQSMQDVVLTAQSLKLAEINLYPKITCTTLHRKAFNLFTAENKDFVTVAEELKVPLTTVLRWASLGDWLGTREKLLKVREREEAQMLSVMRIENRRRALTSQIKTSDRLRGRVEQHLKQSEDTNTPIGPDSLKKLSEAAKAAADMETRALGINGDGMTAFEANEATDSKGGGRQPLVVIVPGGGLPQVRQAKSVDVEIGPDV